ncbi:MAG: PKD domain-containing protein [Bacteroidota bacterium]
MNIFFKIKSKILFSLIFVIIAKLAICQTSGNCDPVTPFFDVNLSSTPNGTWTSSALPRVGNCCGTVAPDKCVEFKILLSPLAVAINFQIASGAVPPGALFYQINCGPPVAVGAPLCLNGPGPYSLTFCKPGNNINTYAITSIAAPAISPDDTIGNGCSTTMYASGLLVNSSISWTSVYPGVQGAYNSYLSCTTGCTATTVSGQPSAPAYVDYMVCGQPAAGACVSSGLFCDTVRIHFSSPIINTITPNPAIFCANNPAGIVLTGNVNGGVPPYTYAWTNGLNGSGAIVGTALNYTATSGGNYSLIVYDKNYPACPPQTTNVTVTVSPTPTINAGPDQTLCGTSVTLAGSVSAATGGIWSGGAGSYSPAITSPNAVYSPTQAELLAGTIVLTFNSTGNGACSAVSDQVIIKIAPPISVNLTAPPVVCFGQTANITSNVTGGFAPYTYSWSNGQTTSAIFNLVAGTYSVAINSLSGVGCSTSSVITIASNPQVIVATSPNNSISCGTFAIISASASGGSGSLTYLWSNGAQSSSTNVYSGTYVVTVTDALGCTGTNSVTVLASNSALVSSVNQPTVLCNGGTITLNVSATGGFGGYSYLWSNNSTSNNIVVGAGNYCATVTDGGGCISSSCVSVIQNSPINISMPAPQTICYGVSGTVNPFISGGQLPYNYSWSNGQTGAALTAVAGNYVLVITDAIGCTASASVAINQAPPINAVVNSTMTSCFGSSDGKASVVAAGGTLPYYYSWSPYGGSGSTTSGLLAGTFSVTVTDGIGCSVASSIVVNQPTALNVSITINNHVSCYGGNNGSATAFPNGGTAGYTYLWMPGGNVSQTPSNLNAGNYIVSVTDSKGCFQTAQTSIVQPGAALTSSLIGVSSTSCFGSSTGSATITGVGGSTPYIYQWLPSGATSATANNLAAGQHTVTTTDLKFCTTQQIITVGQPLPLTATVALVNNVSCNGGNNGTANVAVSGGNAPYFYSWNTAPTQTAQVAGNLMAGNYSVTVTDSKNCVVTTSAVTISQPSVLTVTATPEALISCSAAIAVSSSASGGNGSYTYSWSNGSNTQNISVYSGNYTVTVTDQLGCTATHTVSVQAANNALTATIVQPANLCYGASTTVSVSASGGFGGFSYLWDNNAVGSTQVVQAGAHCVNVTDAGGCIASACVNVIQNQPIVASIATPAVICPLATTTVTGSGSGGQTPYSFLWNNGVSTSTIVAGAGIYTLTVSDITGTSCSNSATVAVVTETPLTLFTGSTSVGCYGGNNGTASVYANGGIPGYTYLWSVNSLTTSIIGSLSAGTYSVLVTDNIGCTKSANVIIKQPLSAVGAITSNTNITCNAATNGVTSAIGTGGTPPYYYYWEPTGISSQTQTGLAAGSYSVIVADSTGCYTSAGVSVTEPTPIIIATQTIASTCGYSNASATITPSGGGGVYTYTWSPMGGNNSTISNVMAGTYTVSVLDNFGCLKLFPVVLPSRISTASPGFSISTVCVTDTSIFTDLSVKGNDSIISWSWDFNDPLSGSNNFSLVQNPSHIYTAVGSYSPVLTIQTAIGCISSFSLSTPFYPNPNPGFLLNSICANSSISFTNTSQISPGSITNYNWIFGDPGSGNNDSSTVLNPVHFYSSAGVFTITLSTISNNNCISTITHSLTVFTLPSASFSAPNGCLNSSTQFTNSSSSNYVKWFWNFGDSSPLDSAAISPVHSFTASGTYSVILTTVSSNGCFNSDTLSVDIFPNPTADFNAPNVCINKTVTLTDLSSVTSGTLSSWEWDFGDFSAPSTSQSPTHTYVSPGTFNVSFTVTSSKGCFATLTKTVGVFPLPVASFSVSSACLNLSSQFTDLSDPGPGATIQSWLWAFGDGSPINTTQAPTHTYALTGVFNPTLVATNSFGCKDTASITLNIFPKPIVSFAIDDTSGCAVFCPKFTDTSTPAGILTNWEWSFGDNSPIDNLQNTVHCFTVTGTYSISLKGTTANGCIATSNQNTAISIHPLPVADFSFTPQDATTSNPEISFTNTSTNAVAWSWFFGDNSELLNTTVNPVHAFENGGEYCVNLLAFNQFGCSDRKTACLNIEMDFTFYVPNAFTPGSTRGANDFFTGYGTNIDKFEMWIFDRWGEKIFHTTDIYTGWDGKAKNSSNIAKQEVYVYKIEVVDFKGNLHKYVGHVTLLK